MLRAASGARAHSKVFASDAALIGTREEQTSVTYASPLPAVCTGPRSAVELARAPARIDLAQVNTVAPPQRPAISNPARPFHSAPHRGGEIGVRKCCAHRPDRRARRCCALARDRHPRALFEPEPRPELHVSAELPRPGRPRRLDARRLCARERARARSRGAPGRSIRHRAHAARAVGRNARFAARGGVVVRGAAAARGAASATWPPRRADDWSACSRSPARPGTLHLLMREVPVESAEVCEAAAAVRAVAAAPASADKQQ